MLRKHLIEARGNQTQTHAAGEIGISQKHLSQLELGERTPTLVTAWRIAEYYEKPLEELFPDVLEKSRRKEN